MGIEAARLGSRSGLVRIAGAILLFSSSCVPDEGPRDRSDVGERTAPLDQADEPVQGIVCGQEVGPELIRLALRDGEEPGQVREIEPDGALEILVSSDASRGGTVSIRARVISGAGFHENEVTRVDVGAHETVSLPLDAHELTLPRGSLDFSGNLILDASLAFDGGGATETVSLPLQFHPVAEGWMIYDQTAREADFGGGALTDAARELQEAAARLTEDKRRAGESVVVTAVDVIEEGGAGR